MSQPFTMLNSERVERLKRSLRACSGHISLAIDQCQYTINAKSFRARNFESAFATLEERWQSYESSYLEVGKALQEDRATYDVIEAQHDKFQTMRLLVFTNISKFDEFLDNQESMTQESLDKIDQFKSMLEVSTFEPLKKCPSTEANTELTASASKKGADHHEYVNDVVVDTIPIIAGPAELTHQAQPKRTADAAPRVERDIVSPADIQFNYDQPLNHVPYISNTVGPVDIQLDLDQCHKYVSDKPDTVISDDLQFGSDQPYDNVVENYDTISPVDIQLGHECVSDKTDTVSPADIQTGSNQCHAHAAHATSATHSVTGQIPASSEMVATHAVAIIKEMAVIRKVTDSIEPFRKSEFATEAEIIIPPLGDLDVNDKDICKVPPDKIESRTGNFNAVWHSGEHLGVKPPWGPGKIGLPVAGFMTLAQMPSLLELQKKCDYRNIKLRSPLDQSTRPSRQSAIRATSQWRILHSKNAI